MQQQKCQIDRPSWMSEIHFRWHFWPFQIHKEFLFFKFLTKFRSSKMAYWSEMARNAIENDFRSCKMSAGSHFVEQKSKKKLRIDLKWREMARNVIGNPKWPPATLIALKWWEMRSKFIFGHPKWGGGGRASQWPACKAFGDIHSICLGKIHQF